MRTWKSGLGAGHWSSHGTRTGSVIAASKNRPTRSGITTSPKKPTKPHLAPCALRTTPPVFTVSATVPLQCDPNKAAAVAYHEREFLQLGDALMGVLLSYMLEQVVRPSIECPQLQERFNQS
jgi:hypothetical protein